MKTWKKLKDTIKKEIKKNEEEFKNQKQFEIEIIDEDQVILVKTEENDKKETVAYMYHSYKDLLNPEKIINTVDKYSNIDRHSILTYLGFSSEVFAIPFINFKAEINIDNLYLKKMSKDYVCL